MEDTGLFIKTAAPNEKSVAKSNLPEGANLAVLAKQGGFLFVRTSIGQLGWILSR